MIDVVVVTHNSADTIDECLSSAASQDVPTRVWVVDASSTDDTAARVADSGVAELIRAPNRGFGSSCNLGARAGDGEWLFFLNPDAVLAPGALSLMAQAAERVEASGRDVAVGPSFEGRVIESDDNYRLWLTPSALWVRRALRRPTGSKTEWPNIAAVNRLSGAGLLVRRSTFERLDGFDERFFLYFEDIDLSLRLRDHGVQLVAARDARLSHIAGHSTGKVSTLTSIQTESNLWLVRKRHGRIAALACAFDFLCTTLVFAALESVTGRRGAAAARVRRLPALRHALRTPEVVPADGYTPPERPR